MQPAARPDRRRHGPAAGRQPDVVGGLRRPHHARQDGAERQQRRAARAGRPAPSTCRPRRSRAQLLTCGDAGQRAPACAGTARRTSRCRSPRTSRQQVALRILEQPRGLPGRARRAAERARLPAARSASTPPTCSATSARSPRTSSTQAERRRRPLGQRRLVGRPGRRREAVRPLAARHARLPAGRGRLDGPGARRGRRDARPARRHPGHLDRRPGAGRRRAAARRRRSRPPGTTLDPVTGRNYVADSGAAVVMEADTGRIVAMASQPTYDPEVWVGGITQKQLDRLYSEKAGTPLLVARHAGPVRARLDLEAVHDRRRADQRLRHRHPARTAPRRSRSATAASRTTSPAPTATSASPRRSRSRATPSSTGSATTSGSGSAPTSPTSTPRTRWSRRPRTSASAARPASTCPGEASGRIADRKWKRAYFESDEGLLLRASPTSRRTARPATSSTGSRGSSASRATPTAPVTRSTSRSARATPSSPRCSWPGRTPRSPTAARSTSRGSARRSSRPTATVIRRIAPEEGRRRSTCPTASSATSTSALKGVTRQGTMAWRLRRLPARRGADPLQDRLGRGLRQAVDVVGRVVHRRLRRGDDGQPGRHRLRHVRSRRSARSGRRSTASTATGSCPTTAAIPGTTPPDGLPDVRATTARSCRRRRGARTVNGRRRGTARRDAAASRPGLGAAGRRRSRCSCSAALLVWSATVAPRRPHRRRPDGVPARSSWSTSRIGLVLMVAGDWRPTTGGCGSWRRWSTLASVVGLVLVLTMGTTDQRLAVVADARRAVDPAVGVRQARRRDRHGAGRRRAGRGPLARPGRHRRRGRDARRSPPCPPR